MDPNQLGNQSIIYIQTSQAFANQLYFRFSLIVNLAYNINAKIQQGLMTESELNLISLKSELVIIRSTVKFTNLLIKSNNHILFPFLLKLLLDDISKSNEEKRFLFLILNSTIVTDYINEGIILLSDCSQRQINSYEGEIEFSGLRVVGQRYLIMQQPLIYIQTLNNVTIDNSELRSFSSINDANKQQLLIESTRLCPFNADQKVKKTQLTNSYISSDAINGKDQSQIQYSISCRQSSDLNKRIQQCIIENLTFENLYSGVTLLSLSQGSSDLTMRNITQNNVSLGPIQAFHFFITGSNAFTL
ncbi:UNKNOWN [Stylonychia lemnae]|uniref:Uncharacterized protein n=1 Tax=Stylonychia lemnae TaxID=5949 RepID=A0A078B305_STYLE|nr:UNKNOWN [Stylonychia lemnae]|eukprot:CDW88885.1 UNKNOWN [Stylonychia lemnae]